MLNCQVYEKGRGDYSLSFFTIPTSTFIAGLVNVAIIALTTGVIIRFASKVIISHIVFIVINLNTPYYYRKLVMIKDFTRLKL